MPVSIDFLSSSLSSSSCLTLDGTADEEGIFFRVKRESMENLREFDPWDLI